MEVGLPGHTYTLTHTLTHALAHTLTHTRTHTLRHTLTKCPRKGHGVREERNSKEGTVIP